MKRPGLSEEVAKVIKFMVSDEASFLTGEIIQVNGGEDFLGGPPDRSEMRAVCV